MGTRHTTSTDHAAPVAAPTGTPPRGGGWLSRRLGVRQRSALAAMTVVAVVLTLAATAFVILHRRSLTDLASATALSRAEVVAERVAAGDQVGLDRLLQTRPGDENVVQVLGPGGTVLAASPEVGGEGPLSPLRPAPGTVQRETRRLPVADEEPFRVIAVGVASPTGPAVVLAGQSLRPVDDAIASEITLLAVGFPPLLLLVGAATAWFVGRSLRAVEALRTQVASITARHLHERVPLPVAEDEVRRLAQTMNAMLDRLERSTATQRRFVADASHELRSPLSTLQVGLELLETRPGTAAEDPTAVPALQAETSRLSRIVADLLLLARVDERGLTPRCEDVDLDDLVDAERRRVNERPGISARARVQPVRIQGDPNQLARALRNLVDNATQHARSTVDMRLWTQGESIHLDVADDGPGIPPADRERVFERFVRLEASRRRATGGSGLGLAIVSEIITGHGGTVTVGDAPGGGAAFHVTLPLGTDAQGGQPPSAARR